MTERLADINARIDGIKQLGAVVNAMKGIAAARAQMARTQVGAVDSYAATIAAAMSRIVRTDGVGPRGDEASDTGRTGLLVFCAEQGFAGAFSERVLDSLRDDIATATLFLIGTRGLSIAVTNGIAPHWTAPLPSHTPGIPKLADLATIAIYHAVAEGRIARLDVVYTTWTEGRPTVTRQRLFPLHFADLPDVAGERPLTQLSEDTLIAALGQDYFNALVCKAALHAFAAENEARMQAMTAAGSQIARELKTFQATLRRVRQEAITAEIIELGTGVVSSRTSSSRH